LVVWIDAAIGGYAPTKGFDPSSKSEVEPIQLVDPVAPEALTDNCESFTSKVRVSLTRHTEHVYSHMVAVTSALGLAKNDSDLLREGVLWHDWGKAHEVFVALTRSALINGIEPPLAKWPRAAKGTPIPEGARKYFRHELASALGFLAQHNWAEAASLSAYLIAAHHGKVRMRLRALPQEITGYSPVVSTTATRSRRRNSARLMYRKQGLISISCSLGTATDAVPVGRHAPSGS
jgi:CRISPR-associated endonuclease/helicase Cas3